MTIRQFIFLFLLVIGAISVLNAQDSGDALSVSSGRIRVGGNDIVLLDGIAINGTPYYVSIAADDTGRWHVTNLDPVDSAATLPRELFLDLALLSVAEDAVLTIEHVYLDGAFYSGTVRFNEELSEVVAYSFVPSAPPDPATHPILRELARIYELDGDEVQGAAEDAASAQAREPVVDDVPIDRPEEAPVEIAEGDLDVAAAPVESGDADAGTALTGASVGSGDAAAADAVASGDSALATDTIERFDAMLRDIQARLGRIEARFADVAAAEARILARIDAVEMEGQRAVSALLSAIAERDEIVLARIDAAAASVVDALPAAVEATADEPGAAATPAADPAPAESAPARRETALAADSVDDLSPTMAIARARSTMTALRSLPLDAGTGVAGQWRLERDGSITQTDPTARYAKWRLDYQQDGEPRLYRLLTRALDDGWAGVGFHLSVAEVQRPRGYGHGESILVWLTRDEAFYGTDVTYLEVYVSSDDVTMDRVAQAQIVPELAETVALEVLFDPGAGFITLAANGVEYLRYRLAVPQGQTMEVALRALGRASFEDIEVRSFR